MSSSNGRRVSVIGAGIVGICSALWLQREGFDVTIIDPNPPGSGASYGNAGCLSPASVVPMSMPDTLKQVPSYLLNPQSPLVLRWGYLPKLAPWLWQFIAAGRRDRIELQSKALNSLIGPVFDCLTSLSAQAGAEHLIRRRGMLYAYRSKRSLLSDSLGWDLRRRHDIEFEQLSGPQIREFDPSLSEEFKEAIYVPGNGHVIDPQDLVRQLFEAALRAGAKVIEAKALGFEMENDTLTGVKVDGRIIAADAAVVACGAHSKRLAADLGDDIPLDTERGYHLMIKTPEAVPNQPVLDAEHKFIATPMRSGLRIAGIVEFAGFKRPPDRRITQRLLRQACAMMPSLRQDYPESEVGKWIGFRPSMPDSIPVIGPSKRSRSVVYAFGHGHVGMSSAPMTGKVVSELLAGRPTSIDAIPFRPDRFGK